MFRDVPECSMFRVLLTPISTAWQTDYSYRIVSYFSGRFIFQFHDPHSIDHSMFQTFHIAI